MEDFVKTMAEQTVTALEILGIVIICLVVIAATTRAAINLFQRMEGDELFRRYRHSVIRGVLMGLDLLVASDIIRTVAVEFTLYSLATLGIIVAIRTLLSFTLEVEMTGKWPWQNGPEE
ncbi:MAG: DUF1622 domain-containing protein [Persicimonas sp.]